MAIWTKYHNIIFSVSKFWIDSVPVAWGFIPSTLAAFPIIQQSLASPVHIVITESFMVFFTKLSISDVSFVITLVSS